MKKVLFRDYVHNDEMRELPLTKKAFFRPSAYGIIKHNNSILLIKDGRSNQWEFPGGGVDIGETFDEACMREIKEETGYDIKCNNQPIHFESECIYAAHKDEYMQSIGLFFIGELASEVREELKLDSPDEIIDMKWVHFTEIEKHPLINYHKKAFIRYLQK